MILLHKCHELLYFISTRDNNKTKGS